MNSRRHPWLAVFFGFGAIMCALTILLLVFPGTMFDALWRLNPEAHLAFRSSGGWSVTLMLIVGSLCGAAASGLALGKLWGVRLAILILCVNVIGDLGNAWRGDYRALIGLPVGGAMIFYLIRARPNLRS